MKTSDSISRGPAPKWAMVVLCSGLLTTLGCGPTRTGPETVPVSGTLTLNGSPVEGADITFVHETFAAFGKTDANGKFQLNPGAVVGENKVVVSKWEGGPSGGVEAGFDTGQFEMMAQSGGANAPKQIFPEEYTDEHTTTLTFSVPEAGSEAADFEL